MGIDLKGLATSYREIRNEFLATATLRFERDLALFSRLAPDALPCLGRLLAPGLRVGVYDAVGLVWAEADRYGQLLTFTTPTNLRRMEVPADIREGNRAVLAFLLALPEDARIVLVWC
ncbi:MAG: hypothetical protein U0840_01180 [Gemmataceae bacterium]